MNSKSGIIHALKIDGDGLGTPIEDEHIGQIIADDHFAWVHLDLEDPASRAWLEKEITYLDHIIIDALLVDETRPRILEFESGALLILRGVNLNEDAQVEDMVSLRIWVDEHRIISIEKHPVRVIKYMKEKLVSGKGPKNSGEFIAMLAAHLFERMEPIFLTLEEDLDNIEEIVMDFPDKRERQGITEIRKKAILFRRYIAPQRDVLSHLRTSEQPWLEQIHKRRLQESLDRVIRYIEDLDTIRERAQIVKDELANGLADNLNKNMYMLSIIAAIFLPLSFFTGLLGINVGGIPGAQNGNAFLFFCMILITIVLLQIFIFKKLKWF